MRDRRRRDRGLRVFALLMGAGWLVACTGVRETPEARSGTMPPAVGSSAVLELQVASDPVVATAGASFLVPVRLRNVSAEPVPLMFLSSCSFRVVIATEDGRELARPEAFCLSVIREPTLEPGAVLEDSVAYTMGEPGVVPLAPGAYRVTPVLLSVNQHAVDVRSARLDVRRP